MYLSKCPDCEVNEGQAHHPACSLTRDGVIYRKRPPVQNRLLREETALPDTNPKTAFGVQKTPLHLVPPALLNAAAAVFGLGAQKYGPYNWRDHKVSSSVYQAAALRHLLAWWDGEDNDPESGQSHLAHVAACVGILIDAKAAGKLNDDRPRKRIDSV